ncbi:indole-3-glycerol phosphate synthase TrpC [Neobacillus jeddahensis]|uniref:indole-3-glycerol phosphate synthase TrpC n=1 Tax=Neobacillus jeddahensis TaxID=1461580 RepID=UPI00058FBCD3|nr:indole-3-glycerol phosphate synthase TrpC [Neobacillus jeddahensis]
MATILDKIIAEKRKEVLHLHQNKQMIQRRNGPIRSFLQKLEDATELSIIAEFKRASPSKGIINEGIEPVQQAVIYEKAGAAAISVLTDSPFFKGSFTDLKAVREKVDIPILCKDFVIDPIQIDIAAANGADLILLIVAALKEEQLMDLFHYAKSKGLEVLVEVHNLAELETAVKTGAKLIGVNNRDLKTFHVSLGITEQLAPIVKQYGAYLISESGIHKQEDAERVRNVGARGVLVGESLMISQDVNKSFLNLRIRLKGAVNK